MNLTTHPRCLIISPHLDDAVFSAGSFLHTLVEQAYQITVMTLFTNINTIDPETAFAKKFVANCGFSNSEALFNQRKVEDQTALKLLGISQIIHADFIDAAWRTHNHCHLYPTDSAVFSGKINSDDNILNELFAYSPIRLFASTIDLLLSPLGIGNHADHVITHQLALKLSATQKLFWADQPYSQYSHAKPKYHLYKTFHPNPLKTQAVNCYSSQLISLNPQYHPAKSPELIYD